MRWRDAEKKGNRKRVCVCGGGGGEREREREREIKLYFSTVTILAQRPTHISAVATVLLLTKIFTVKYHDRRI